MIREGRVRLNGAVASLGDQANPESDRIEVDGKLIQPQERPQFIYLLLNKPLGIVSTCQDNQGRTTVLDLLPPQWRSHQGIHPVGRLDAYSTGALILTNDGSLTFRLTHPRHEIPKVYEVWLTGAISPHALEQWQQGILLDEQDDLDEQPTLPAQVQILQKKIDRTLLQITIKEGKNRQIRRIAAHLGYPVISLHRVAIGIIRLTHPDYPLLLGGRYRPLTKQEVEFLREE